MAKSARAVVLCADDYGLNEGVSRGIRELAEMGRISATSCMTNAPGWPDAARELRALDRRLGIGLHVTLTWGAPLGPMPSLAPAGILPPLGSVLRRAFTGGLDSQEIGSEVERQLVAFERALGRPPDFVDGHQHVHVLPGIRGSLLDALSRRSLAGRAWLRDPTDRVGAILARRVSAPKALLVAALAIGFRVAAARAGFATNNGFSGFSPFDPAADPAPTFKAALDRLGPRPVVMCHPGQPARSGERDLISRSREAELRYLCSDRFATLLESRRLELAPSP